MTDHLDQPIDNGEPAPPSPRRVDADGEVLSKAPTPEQEAEFARWRDQIDALDQQLVLAINERAKVVQQVGEAGLLRDESAHDHDGVPHVVRRVHGDVRGQARELQGVG